MYPLDVSKHQISFYFKLLCLLELHPITKKKEWNITHSDNVLYM